jgi:AcrR family transcriptional regulator
MGEEWFKFQAHILELEQKGLVTRTFRRLDPDRQQAVVNAVLEESAEKGPASLNIKAVAVRAGVSVGSLYQYFPKRQGLLDFAIELCVRYMTDAFDEFQPYLAALPLKEALKTYLTSGIEWGQTEAGLVRFFGRAAYQGDAGLSEQVVRPIATAMREVIDAILAQAAARGEIRSDVDLEAAARVINALLIAVGDSQLLPYLNAYFQVTDDEMPSERILEALLDIVSVGLQPKAK